MLRPDPLRRKLKDLYCELTHDASLEMPIRLFRLFCLVVTVLTLFIVLPVNLFQNLPILVNVGDVLTGLFALFCFWESTHGRHHTFLFLIVMILLMEPVWFLNSGTNGSITFYLVVMIVYPMLMFRGLKRWTLAVCMTLNICALLIIDYFLPSLTVPFRSQGDRVLDVISGAFCSCLGLMMIIWAVISSYDRERERTENYARDLAETHHRLKTTMAAIPDLTFELDAYGHIYDYHTPATELLYVPPEAFLGKTVEQVLPPDAATVILNALTRAAKAGVDRGASYALDMTGGRRWFELSIAIKPGGSAPDARFVVLTREITERKRTEEALRASEEESRATFEQAAVGIAHVGTNGRLLRVNDKFCAIVGYPREELAQLTFQDITHPEDLETDLDYMRQVLSGTIKTYAMEKRYFRKDRSVVWVNLTVSLVRNGDGQPRHFVSVVEDITERKRAEEELTRIRLQLWHADRVAQTAAVAASLAHELNQPLGAILTNAEVGLRFMAGANPDLGEIREIFADIVQDDMRAGAVVRGLRDLLRRKETRREEINLADTIRRTIELLNSELQGKQVQLHLTLQPNSLVLADKAQVQQVILNLVMNAVEAMQIQPAGQRRLELTTTHSNASEALVAVCDSGPGIPADQHGKMFEAFWTTKQDGLGVGLMISRSIIESHRGRIWFANNPDKGVTFNFTLPLMVESDLTGRETAR